MLALFCRVRECDGKGESDAPHFKIDFDLLREYMDAESELCDGAQRTEIIDAMITCRNAINPG